MMLKYVTLRQVKKVVHFIKVGLQLRMHSLLALLNKGSGAIDSIAT